MVNAINKVLRDCIPDIIMSFLDDIPIKGWPVEEKDETIRPDGCRKFVATYIDDNEKVLQRLEDGGSPSSAKNRPSGNRRSWSSDTYLCGPYGRKLSLAKVEAISAMKHDCNSATEVRIFLGACAFYHI
jgi:hypothetical protein